MILFALVSGSLLGFGIGFFGFKVKTRWCRTCGTTLICPACMSMTAHRSGRSG